MTNKVCYMLFGYGNNINKYDLEDVNGNKININNCNGLREVSNNVYATSSR